MSHERIERLEDRSCPALAVSLAGGVLDIDDGGDAINDTVTLVAYTDVGVKKFKISDGGNIIMDNKLAEDLTQVTITLATASAE